jgi:hypothetical protein
LNLLSGEILHERTNLAIMTASANRISTYTTGSGEADGRNGEQKKNLWQSMLESVASGKRLPEKNLLVLGKTSNRTACLIGSPYTDTC